MAARFCAKCGKEISSAAKFCPNCAASLTPAATPLEVASQGSRRLLVPAMIAALVVLTLAVVLLLNRKPQPSVLVAQPIPIAPAPALVSAPIVPQPAAAPVISAPTIPATPAPAVTNAPTAPVPALPPDAAAYLSFLQGIDKRRVALNRNVADTTAFPLINQMMGSLMNVGQDDADDNKPKAPDNSFAANKALSDELFAETILMRDFRANNPPQTCLGIANAYYNLLSDYSTLISQVQVGLLNKDPSLTPGGEAAVNSASQGNITGALQSAIGGAKSAEAKISDHANAADTQLGDLCNRYGVAKPFAISPDGASPSLLGQ